jgi:hypothetical protein
MSQALEATCEVPVELGRGLVEVALEGGRPEEDPVGQQ